MSDGQLLYQTANSSYRRRKSEKSGRSVYGGFEWAAAVAQTMRNQTKEGKRKDRRTSAEEITARVFDKARASTPTRLDRVAACVGPEGSQASGERDELQLIAEEVYAELVNEDKHSGAEASELVSGMIDIPGLINLIMGIIQAIRACKNPQPQPQPNPV